MIIVMHSGTPGDVVEQIREHFRQMGLVPEKIVGEHQVVIGLVGETASLDEGEVQQVSPYIQKVMRVGKKFKRASLEFRHGQASTVAVSTPRGVIPIGRHHPIVIMDGPCSVENEEMIVATARAVAAAGAHFLRGGAYKPRTSPYDFQGHGESALELLAAARAASGLGIVTEVMDAADLDKIAAVADIVQVGARNMQNFALLKKVGSQPKPVLLKRGPAATLDEWLMAAEYILAAGNDQVILCERGIRTFDSTYTRNTLDLSAIPAVQSLSHLPVMVDPSHGTGKSQFVAAMSRAAVAAGTDGLMIEVHPDPAKALSDGPQSLTFAAFEGIMRDLAPIGRFLGRWSESLVTV